jgi:hypothetical protein
MRRRCPPLPTVLIAAALVGPAATAHAAVPLDKVPPLAARVVTCTTGADDESRAAVFSGSMPAAAGTRRMMMRFVLQQRLGSVAVKAPFKTVKVPGWGDWERSDVGRRGFVFTKRVEALAAPAGYRAQVTFRWLDAKGHVQRTTTRRTPVCEQPDPRPDLVLSAVSASAVNATTAAYSVSVANEGHGDADPFAVTVTVDDVTSDPLTLGPVTAGARATGALAAPRCAPGSTITITIDAADAVAESDEADDVVERPCPLS